MSETTNIGSGYGELVAGEDFVTRQFNSQAEESVEAGYCERRGLYLKSFTFPQSVYCHGTVNSGYQQASRCFQRDRQTNIGLASDHGRRVAVSRKVVRSGNHSRKVTHFSVCGYVAVPHF